MKIVLSNHAKKRLVERNIKMEDIAKTIEMPDYTITKGTKIEAHKKFSDRTLKVVYVSRDRFISIITLIWK